MTLSIMTAYAEHDDAVRRLCLAGLARLQSLHLKILLKVAPSVSSRTNPRKGTTLFFSRETFEPLGQLTSLTGLHIEAYTCCGNIDTIWLSESLRPVVQKLKSLKLWLRADDPGTALQLGHLSALTSLDLSGSNGITRVMLASIAQLTPLEHLSLSSCSTRIPSDVPFGDLRHLKSLLTSDVSLNYGILNGRLAELRHLSTLCVLHLVRCVQLTDLRGLRHLASLTILDLSVCRRVTDAGVAELRALKALTDLNLSHCYKITDAGMAELKNLTALRMLSLRACWNITYSGLEELSHLPQLANLDLSECTSGSITAAGVGMLTKRLLGLQVLNLDHVNITDEELEQLKVLFSNAHLSRKMWTDSFSDLNKLINDADDAGSLIS